MVSKDPIERGIQYINTIEAYVIKQEEKEAGINPRDLGDLIFTAADSIEEKIYAMNPGFLTPTQHEALKYITTLKENAYTNRQENILPTCKSLKRAMTILNN